jgi:hypothetical protein
MFSFIFEYILNTKDEHIWSIWEVIQVLVELIYDINESVIYFKKIRLFIHTLIERKPFFVIVWLDLDRMLTKVVQFFDFTLVTLFWKMSLNECGIILTTQQHIFSPFINSVVVTHFFHHVCILTYYLFEKKINDCCHTVAWVVKSSKIEWGKEKNETHCFLSYALCNKTTKNFI